MTGRSLTVIGWLTLVTISACVDIESGEMGAYGSPCTGGFQSLLLCDREAGGADPKPPGGGGGGGGGGGEPATCTDACEILVSCQGSGTVAECVAECQGSGVPQSLLDCIVANGCNFGVCLEGDSP